MILNETFPSVMICHLVLVVQSKAGTCEDIYHETINDQIKIGNIKYT